FFPAGPVLPEPARSVALVPSAAPLAEAPLIVVVSLLSEDVPEPGVSGGKPADRPLAVGGDAAPPQQEEEEGSQQPPTGPDPLDALLGLGLFRSTEQDLISNWAAPDQAPAERAPGESAPDRDSSHEEALGQAVPPRREGETARAGPIAPASPAQA